ncbi:4171_t:CDS:10 [Paraglomus brasilianum]|uniref:4171_t:CDS:1 n=1 Tax=Paraglomus brasilianum TaxID=144538 RepID=A0A9N9FRV4_9GLOM|nr:4171_t:CDS:10 [Paraglomus brasilianum]
MEKYKFETLAVSFLAEYVISVQLNRAEKLNAFNSALWRDLKECFTVIKDDSTVRAVILSAAGKHFTAGLDLNDFPTVDMKEDYDSARQAHRLRLIIKSMQESITVAETCDKPIITVTHGACLGAGIDLITACDIRYCSRDAYFCVKEVDISIAADLGTLQRLPKATGNDSAVRELCLTARRQVYQEAASIGLISKVLDSKEAAIAEATKTAILIASKSPVATTGTKHLLNYSRDHSVAEGLAYTLAWSQAMTNTRDIPEAIDAVLGKRKPTFSKL